MMKSYPNILLALCVLTFLFQACSGRSVETITVDRPATTPAPPDRLDDVEGASSGNIIRIGEINKISSFDPLFALNAASQRTIQMIYEGLVVLNAQEQIIPAGARQWQVSDDSLQYTFRLNRNVYFHDDQSFGSGIGRRVRASDYKQAFERMTSRDVPPNAARLFMDRIRGFEAYFYEQRDVYDPEERTLDEINGVRAVNDSTLTFTLIEPDADFLHKLASPFAVVYPGEALRYRSRGIKDEPVGSGPFAFGASFGDTLHVLQKNLDYYRTANGDTLPLADRVEILNISDETEIFRQIVLGRLNAVMDMGPEMIRTLIDSGNELQSSYRDQFDLEVINHREPFVVRYNPDNRFGIGSGHAAALANWLSFDSLKSNSGNPSLELAYRAEGQANDTYLQDLRMIFPRNQNNRLLLAFSSDASAQLLSAGIIDLYDQEFNAALMDRRVFSRNVILAMEKEVRYTPGAMPILPQEILRFNKDRYFLTDKRIQGIRLNSYSWWLDLKHAVVTESL